MEVIKLMSKAIIRKAAPLFKSQAWWQNKFQEVSLDQFKGKPDYPLLKSRIRKVRCTLLLATWFHFRVPNWNLPIQRQSRWIWSHQHAAHWMLNRLALCSHGVYQERKKVRRPRSNELAHACWSYSLNLTWLRSSNRRGCRCGYCIQRYFHHRRSWYSASYYYQRSARW